MLLAGVSRLSTRPPTPAGAGDPDRHLEDLAAELGRAGQLRRRRRSGRSRPGACRGPTPASRSHELERLAHPGLDDLADLEPADRPAGLLAEDRDVDLARPGRPPAGRTSRGGS